MELLLNLKWGVHIAFWIAVAFGAFAEEASKSTLLKFALLWFVGLIGLWFVPDQQALFTAYTGVLAAVLGAVVYRWVSF